jgi:ABC-type nickel/cobalt efflux system permease component RcnA
MNDRTIVYSTYYNPIEANIIKARLEDSGFSCFLADENVATINPLYNQAIGGIKLIVFERDVDQINQLLAEDNSGLVDVDEQSAHQTEEKILCEACGSDHVGYGMATKKKFSWWAILIPVLVGVFLPFKGNKCHHCYNCGHEFK